MITTIIFDWGGVFTGQGKFSTFIHKMCRKYEINDFSRIKKESHLLWEDAKLGKISSETFFENLAEDFNLTSNEFEEDLIRYYKYNNELIKIVKILKENNYKIGILTNNVRKWFEDSLKETRLDDFFDFIIPSYDYHLAKPQKEIYEKTLKLTNSNPQEILFIDDLDRNLKPARDLGFKTHLFIDNETLLEELERLGVKI